METAPLTDLCTPKQWKPLPQASMTPSGYPVYGAKGLLGYYTQYNHKHPVIAIGSRGCGCGTVYQTQPESYITANALCLEALNPAILPEYLYYYLRNYNFAPIITGAAQPQITTAALQHVLVRYGSHHQQRSIVHRLKQCDLILNKQVEQLHQLRLLKTAHFFHLQERYLTHQDFCIMPLSYLAHIYCGKRDAGEACNNGAYPFFTCAKHTQSINHFDFDCECVLISGNIDFRVQYFNGKFAAYQRIYVLVPKDPGLLSTRYLFSYLSHNPQLLNDLSIGTSIKYLKKKDLQQTSIWLPPIELQHRIAHAMQHADAAIANALHAIEQTQLLSQKLVQNAWPV